MTSLARLTTASADCERVSEIRPLPNFLHRSIHDPLEIDNHGVDIYRAIMIEVSDLATRILNGYEPLPKIASAASSSTNFGVAHCLAHLIKMDLLVEPMSVDQILNMIYTEDLRLFSRDGSLNVLTFKRFDLLEHLEAFGLLCEKASPRDVRPVGSTPPFKALASLVCEGRDGITLETIRSADRTKPVIAARFDLIYIMRKVCGHSLTSIGQQIHRDHSSVLSAIASQIAKINAESVDLSSKAKSNDKGKAEAIEELCREADNLGVQMHFDMQMRQI